MVTWSISRLVLKITKMLMIRMIMFITMIFIVILLIILFLNMITIIIMFRWVDGELIMMMI